MSDKEETKPPVIQDPIVPHENYDVTSSYKDDVIPGPSIELPSLYLR
eukprot:CAMPEP_0201161640 /NCGR_PEP_ID=MMETSP0851-20130426/47593_1 /ASSEMBLY_ACC=CAM_ASM_000631 /TAXON_ID=183588 /ORGANISM="Pseudo-nitzschia fraudulenta, Strain WWA7" /LENGTH=46 /DNA_ID= /DNA_START= /DNA_END= /DNA_ORIENTATION=